MVNTLSTQCITSSLHHHYISPRPVHREGVSGRVDIADLTWEQKEQVLRLLFSRINKTTPTKQQPLPQPAPSRYTHSTTGATWHTLFTSSVYIPGATWHTSSVYQEPPAACKPGKGVCMLYSWPTHSNYFTPLGLCYHPCPLSSPAPLLRPHLEMCFLLNAQLQQQDPPSSHNINYSIFLIRFCIVAAVHMPRQLGNCSCPLSIKIETSVGYPISMT